MALTHPPHPRGQPLLAAPDETVTGDRVWPRLTRGDWPLLPRVSCVHGAVTEQGPSFSPALSPTWRAAGHSPSGEGQEELG